MARSCRSRIPLLAALALSAATAAGASPAAGGAARWRLVSIPGPRILATYAQDIAAPDLRARAWVVYAPLPPELPGQRDVRASIEPRGGPALERSPLRRRVLRSRVRAGDEETRGALAVTVSYEATLVARRLEPAPPHAAEPVPALDRAERAAWLRESAHYDYRAAPFQAWLDRTALRRGEGDHVDGREGAEDDVAFARRAFLAITRAAAYEYVAVMDRTASAVCAAARSDCGGLSVLFVAAMRANGIPARCLVGRWAQSARPGAHVGAMDDHQQHVKAEFFADGVGWVPVDLASAVLHDRSEDGLRHFGVDRGDFLTLHVDPDLELDSELFGRQPVAWLQDFAYWASGDGTFDGATVAKRWTVDVRGAERAP